MMVDGDNADDQMIVNNGDINGGISNTNITADNGDDNSDDKMMVNNEQLPEPMDTDDDNNNNTNNDNDNQQNELLPELMECRSLLTEFMRRPETEPFNEPVDWKGLNLPDYPLIITKPMDLGTVSTKLECNQYSS